MKVSGYRIEQFTSIQAKKLHESNKNNNSPDYRSPLHTKQAASQNQGNELMTMQHTKKEKKSENF